MSVFCPHCSKRLILEDFKIQTYYAVRDFSTCGDIVVEKKGHVVAPIRANNLTVRGKVQGKVFAQGRVLICKTAWFKGDITAPIIEIESGAAVDAFLTIGETGNGAGPA
jgi:cytoskeletal protein CcmA (bactofilin family)